MAHSLTEQAKVRKMTVPEMVKTEIEAQGSITRAAIELKVSTNALRYWIRRAGLRLERPRIVVHETI